ncbi:glycosyltransferase WbuB, partial [Ascidiaceihabitans sp.]|nr:glycosyltransferase WbuB [Ascidiaceihabitans sp.]
MANLFHRKPVVIDIQDLWPDTLSATGMIQNAQALKVVGWLCNWLYNRVSHIVVLSPGFKEILMDRGVNGNKITHIYNWAPDEGAQSDTSVEAPAVCLPKDRFNIVYAGNMGPAQGLHSMVAAAAQCQDAGSSIYLTFIGTGLSVDQLKEAARTADLTNISFHPPVA